MDSKMEKSDATQVLTLKGALTIERANELKLVLLDALDKNDNVVLNLEAVTEVDLSCLQLLCSAHRTSLDRHKQLSLEGRQPESFQQTVRDAGYTRPVGCHKESHQRCLWI